MCPSVISHRQWNFSYDSHKEKEEKKRKVTLYIFSLYDLGWKLFFFIFSLPTHPTIVPPPYFHFSWSELRFYSVLIFTSMHTFADYFLFGLEGTLVKMVLVDTSLGEIRIMPEDHVLIKLGNVGMKHWLIASLAFLTKKEDVLVSKDRRLDSFLTSLLFNYPRMNVMLKL